MRAGPEVGRRTPPILRPMDAKDVDRVVDIERSAFTTPWKAETFHSLRTRDNVEIVVLELPEAGVVGYAVLWCVYEHGELANLAIDEAHRGRGLGSRLLDLVMKRALELGVRNLYLEVRESNEPAAALYDRRGFREIGRRRNYYDRPKEDARVLLKRLR